MKTPSPNGDRMMVLQKIMGPICTVGCWPPVSSSGYDAGTRTSKIRSIRRCTSPRLMKERSRTPRTTRGPLVPSEPNGVSDGNGLHALLLSGDESERVVESSGSGLGSCSVSFKSGNRHLITERSLPTGKRGIADRPHSWLSGKDTKNVEG